MYEEEAGKPVDRAASFGSEAVDSIKTVSAFGQELQILRTLTKLSEPNHERRNKLAFAASLFFGLSQAIPCVIVAIFFFYGGKRYADGSSSLATVRLCLFSWYRRARRLSLPSFPRCSTYFLLLQVYGVFEASASIGFSLCGLYQL